MVMALVLLLSEIVKDCKFYLVTMYVSYITEVIVSKTQGGSSNN